MENRQEEKNIQSKIEELEQIWKQKDDMSRMGKVAVFYKSLLPNYSRDVLLRIKLFHLILGSTTSDQDSPEFDLPNGEIERFIREEL